MLTQRMGQYKNAFKIFTDIGPILILGPQYAHELRNDDRLSLQKFTSRVNRSPSALVDDDANIQPSGIPFEYCRVRTLQCCHRGGRVDVQLHQTTLATGIRSVIIPRQAPLYVHRTAG